MEMGFTGTQHGMTDRQRKSIIHILLTMRHEIGHVHHGDCIGADEKFDGIAADLGIPRVIHPPNEPGKRAFCKGEVILPVLPYLERNRMIVADTSELIVCPRTMEEEIRSGTWYTFRYAKAHNRTVMVVYPRND
ncbi:hypothetical protein LCGC14_2322030 [marine sediment metagenome]|uniref:Uncharacterized protein n=1 Tax=marine sediment metagenome TaxID=412755 RepID=A0A0F9FCD3_9ZZZZ